jgi:exonuclease SbcD
MKFVFATDTHLKGRNPSSRTDDFPKAMITKLEELCLVAEHEAAEAILHGGDLFDVPDVSNTLIGYIASILKRCPVPFYLVPGNHDLFGYNLTSLPQTALGVLVKAGLVQLLTRQGSFAWFGGQNTTVAVQG